MKKALAIFIIFTAIVCISSCDYDDSNDIDVLTPHDSIADNTEESS
ncbi:hypothetical protein [Aurantibacter sp.]